MAKSNDSSHEDGAVLQRRGYGRIVELDGVRDPAILLVLVWPYVFGLLNAPAEST